MSKAVLYIGKSGAGKSTAMRNLNPETTFLISCVGKEFPWKGSEKQYSLFSKKNLKGNMAILDRNEDVIKALHFINETRPEITDICIDDNTFITSLELLRRIKEASWDKYSEIAQNFIELTRVMKSLRSDLIIHVLHHEEVIGDGVLEDYNHRAQTYGKLINEKLGSIEAQFSIVLRAAKEVDDDQIKYIFYTAEANSSVKTPMEMFNTAKIPNDIQLVSTAIREYYN